ncbi:MAG: serpin family protein [Planctomycetaceae bacterium]|jgi:serpin B|nr:serpin family protein [Planctomycetaceae bacterium]
MSSQFLRSVTAFFSFVAFLFSAINFSSFALASESADQLVLFRNSASGVANDNISISPYGVNLALALIFPGVKGDAAAELELLLGEGVDAGKLAESLKIAEYAKVDSPIKTATSLWIQQGFNVLPEFTDTAKKNFAAEVSQVDFQTNSTDACKDINDWVDKNTKSKIKKLFDKVDPSSRVIAVSAIYFLADWVKPFDKNKTKSEDFTLLNGEKKKVKMMRNPKTGKTFKYGEGLNSQWMEIPYKNKGFSAVVILPERGIDPADVIAKLTPENFDNMIKTLKSKELDVKLPQFEVEYSTSLKKPLINAGVQKIFSTNADFSGITPSKELIVSEVIQKVFIKVDETGTEAAAATGITMVTTSLNINLPKEFYVDRPFIFIVKEGNNILFISKITKP